jgi:hypothetical protein
MKKEKGETMNKQKKNLFGIFAMVAIFTLFAGTTIATTGKCYWETTNPALTDGTITMRQTEKSNVYPIWDMSVAGKVLRTNKITSYWFSPQMNGTIIKVSEATGRTSYEYLEDLNIIRDNCELKQYRALYGYSKARDQNEKPSVKEWIKENCGKKCGNVRICAFKQCKTIKICLPHCQ